MEECVFCKIIRKESPAHIVYESDTVISFLDIDPINEGHVLIVPKLHVSSLDDMPIDILVDVMQLSQKMVKAHKKIYGVKGYTMMQNGGRFCDFGHGHFHIFPRYELDGFGWECPGGPFAYSEDVANVIREELDKLNYERNAD